MIQRQHYLDNIWAHKDKPLVKVLTGLRRCGKSTLLQLYRQALLASGVSQAQIVHINFESGQFAGMRDHADLYRYVRQAAPAGQKVYILLDEVQAVAQWEKAVNAFRVDLNADLTITGSNAYVLSGELATLLSGRYVEIEVYPLSFSEYCRFTSVKRESQASLPRETLFNQYLRYGGLPVLFEYDLDEQLIGQIMDGLYSTIIRKDILYRNRISDASLLDRLTAFLMDNIGSPISSKKIADTLGSTGAKTTHNTVLSYLDMLKSAYIFYPAKRYNIKGREHLRTLDKHYLCDPGFRHALLGYRNADTGHLLENAVFMELRYRGYQVSTGLVDDYEVDFVAQKRDKLLYIQVCQSVQDAAVLSRELRPLHLLRDSYPRLLVTRDYPLTPDLEGVQHLNVIDFMLGNAW